MKNTHVVLGSAALVLAMSLHCNNDNTQGGEGQPDMTLVDPNADMTGSGGGQDGGGTGDGGTTPDLATTALLLTTAMPALGPSEGGVMITLSGANFVAGATVKIGGLQATVVSLTPTQIVVTLPAKLGAKGPAPIDIVNGDGKTVTQPALFRYYLSKLSFVLKGKIDVGARPVAVAIGDLNKNNRLDVVSANLSGNSISFALGGGDGTFGMVASRGTSALAASQPTGLALGDFNKDGFLDVVASNQGRNNVGVLLGDGAGLFGGVLEYGVGMVPLGVASADLNNDMLWDVVTANSASNNATLLYGQAGGALGGAQTLADGALIMPGPSAVVLADVNGDNKADVLVANQLHASVSVYLSNAGGTAFTLKGTYPTGTSQPRGIVVADFTGDGVQDIAVSLIEAGKPGYVGVLAGKADALGKGDGTFTTSVRYNAGQQNDDGPFGVASADFNGDGVSDAVVGLSANLTNLAVLVSKNGALDAPVFVATGKNSTGVAVGDLDGDGLPDIVSANAGDNQLGILLNRSQ